MSGPARDQDIDARAIAMVSGVLALLIVAIVAAVFGWRHVSSMRPTQPQRIEVAPGAAALQPSPIPERQLYELDKASVLASYGWVDRGAGIVRIPIDRAMQRLVERAQPAGRAATTGEPVPGAATTGGAPARASRTGEPG